MNEIANSKNPLTWDVFAAKRRVATRDLGECALQNPATPRSFYYEIQI